MRASRPKVALAAVAVAALAVAGCAESNRDDSSGGSKKDTLVFGVAGDPKVLDPSFASDGESLRVARQVFETLVRPEEGGTKVTPGLAETWTPDAAGTTWTFKLRSGVKFHDGTEFNAEAVCNNFDRWYNATGLMQSPDVTPYWQDVIGGFAKNESAGPAAEPLQVLHRQGRHDRRPGLHPGRRQDPGRAVAALVRDAQPDGAGEVRRRATWAAPPRTSSTRRYADGAPDRHRPVQVRSPGTSANKTLTIERNDDYCGRPRPRSTRSSSRPSRTRTPASQALQAGDIDGYDLVGPADIEPLKGAGFKVLTRAGVQHPLPGHEPEGEPGARRRSRSARRIALRDRTGRAGRLEAARRAPRSPTNFMPDTVDGYNGDVTKYPYDPAKAKALLAEAGATNLTLQFHYPTEVTRPYMPNPKDIFELHLRPTWRRSASTSRPSPLKWSPDYLNATSPGNKHDLHLLGWTGDYNDALQLRRHVLRTGRRPEWGFTNKALFDQLARPRTAPPTRRPRTEKYKALNKADHGLPARPSRCRTRRRRSCSART